jgi:hypothetical protein
MYCDQHFRELLLATERVILRCTPLHNLGSQAMRSHEERVEWTVKSIYLRLLPQPLNRIARSHEERCYALSISLSKKNVQFQVMGFQFRCFTKSYENCETSGFSLCSTVLYEYVQEIVSINNNYEVYE